jgi:hypothetical protein
MHPSEHGFTLFRVELFEKASRNKSECCGVEVLVAVDVGLSAIGLFGRRRRSPTLMGPDGRFSYWGCSSDCSVLDSPRGGVAGPSGRLGSLRGTVSGSIVAMVKE